MKNCDVVKKYGVLKNTISTWKKKADKIVSVQESSKLAPKRRIRSGHHNDLDTALLQWFTSVRDQNVPINGKITQEKALQYARSCKSTTSWLQMDG